MRSLALLSCVLAAILPLGTAQDPGQDITCSETKLCAEGCCGLEGICGMGPEFCGPGKCINSCDAKSECDPAGWGPTYAKSEKCPLNVCCSRFGFCGATEEFCGAGGFAGSPRCSGASATKRTIGYYEGWGIGRPCGAIYPEDLYVGAYTHLNFAFAMIDPNTFEVVPMIDSDKEMYQRLTALKDANKGLEVWISIGGWSMNDPGPTYTTFSDLAGSAANQQRFFRSLISFMNQYGFDGVDIDWEYPGAEERGGNPSDFANFPVMLRNLRKAFAEAGHNWGITVTFPASFWYLQHFDVKAIEQAVDWINVMTYDIHGTWDAVNKWEGPYIKPHTDLREIDAGLKLLWRNDINPANVVLGIGFYGRSFKLADPSCTDIGCPFTGGGDAGECTGSEGTLSYAEVLQLVADGNKPTLNSEAGVQMLTYNGDNWVSYDDETTLKMKVDWANNNCLGGTMVWAASLDDKAGSAAAALSGLTGQPDRYKVGIVIPKQGLGQCTWTGCSQACPPGTTVAGGNWPVSPLGCPAPHGNALNQRLFCCPIGNVPECVTRGGPKNTREPCTPGCEAGEVAVASNYKWIGFTDENFCLAGGYESMCCKETTSVDIFTKCTWTDCGASCPSNQPRQILQTLRGDAGMNVCTSGKHSLCCEDPPPVENCQWYRNAFHNTCTPGCPSGKIELAIDNQGPNCASGFGSYCCDISPTGSLASRDSLDEWEYLVENFINNGVCDVPTPTFPGLRRDLTPVVQPRDIWEHGVVKNSVMAARVAFLLAAINRAYYWQAKDQLTLWDYRMKNSPSPYKYWTSENLLAATRLDAPESGDPDPVGVITDLFCCGESCGKEIALAASAGSDVCFPLSTQNSLATRAFNPYNFDANGAALPNGTPAVGRLLYAIVQNQVRLEYVRYFRYVGGNSQSTETEMELVYLLGTSPTNMVGELMDSNEHRFAIIHVHFSAGYAATRGADNTPQRTDGLGIASINVAHGTHIERRRGRWQVQGRGTSTDIFNCNSDRPVNSAPVGASHHYIPGSPGHSRVMQQYASREVRYNALGRFMNHLFLRNYLYTNNPAWVVRETDGTPESPIRYMVDQLSRWQYENNNGLAMTRVGDEWQLYNPERQNGADLMRIRWAWRS